MENYNEAKENMLQAFDRLVNSFAPIKGEGANMSRNAASVEVQDVQLPDGRTGQVIITIDTTKTDVTPPET